MSNTQADAVGGKVWTPEVPVPVAKLPKSKTNYKNFFRSADMLLILGAIAFIAIGAIFAVKGAHTLSQSNEKLSALVTTQKSIANKCHISDEAAGVYLGVSGDYSLSRNLKFTTGDTKTAMPTVATVQNYILTMKDSAGKTLCSVKINN